MSTNLIIRQTCQVSRFCREAHSFNSNLTVLSNSRLELAKTQAKTKQQLEAELLLSENHSLCSFTLSSKNNRRYSKKCAKTSVSILIGLYMINYDENETENKMKMKNRSHRYDMNRPRPTLGSLIRVPTAYFFFKKFSKLPAFIRTSIKFSPL